MTRRLASLSLSLAILVSLGLNATATETTTVILDGAWWTTLTQSEKGAAIEGMVAGYSAGWADGVYDAAVKATPRSSVWPRWLTPALKSTPNMSNRTVAVMIKRLDTVFEDHPGRAKWLVSSFLVCAAASGRPDCARRIRTFQR